MAFTYFFRDSHTLELTVKHMAPEVMGRSRIRIWDAGCAMGPEPYTLAILCAENLGKFAFKNLSIQATDVDEANNFGHSETLHGLDLPLVPSAPTIYRKI
jgi:chemotaxis protein methyltransferase CheR